MIELFSDVTFSAELLAGGVALPNEMDVKVLSELPLLFSDVPSVVVQLESASLSRGLGLAPTPEDSTNIAIQIGRRILCITALPCWA